MVIKRDAYLNRLISKKHNGLIKVITGIRRCGKSKRVQIRAISLKLHLMPLKTSGIKTRMF